MYDGTWEGTAVVGRREGSLDGIDEIDSRLGIVLGFATIRKEVGSSEGKPEGIAADDSEYEGGDVGLK